MNWLTLTLQDAAGQMRKSPFSFSGIGPTSPLLWLAHRYAILDGPSMPIIAEGDGEPNDTYVEQLVAGAQAAVEVSVGATSSVLHGCMGSGQQHGQLLAARHTNLR